MNNLDILKKSQFFSEVKETDITPMLSCLGARNSTFKKGEYVLRAGEEVHHIGIVIGGILNIYKEDADGERSLLARLLPADYFGEALCCAGVDKSPVNVVAESNCEVMFIDFKRILNTCSKSCVFHAKIIENMLKIVAVKNLQLQQRMEYLSKKTLRKRILKYLTNTSAGKSGAFSIPFNREELSDYLCADRSALSRELMRLKDDGIIDYWKNQFQLL